YGALSSPTPDTPGWVEAIIGICLLAAIPFRAVLRYTLHDRTLRLLTLVAATLLILPATVALIQQRDPTDMLRDLIPLGYFFLPWLLYPLVMQNAARTRQVLLVGLCI